MVMNGFLIKQILPPQFLNRRSYGVEKCRNVIQNTVDGRNVFRQERVIAGQYVIPMKDLEKDTE